MLWLSCQS